MKKPLNPVFLGSPAEIRHAIHTLSTQAKSLDLAVAFVGPEWHRLLTNYSGPLRTVCWLNHPATDPDAVQSMMNRVNAAVRQRTGLHTKVYIAPGLGAVVGSANLSQSALTDRAGSPQCEAAVLVSDPHLVNLVSNWFQKLWRDAPRTRSITEADLQHARKERKKWPIPRLPTPNPVPPLPDPLPARIVRLARNVDKTSLLKQFGRYNRLLKGISNNPGALSRSDLKLLVDYLSEWTKHRAAFRSFEKRPLSTLRQGLGLLFDEGQAILDRLNEIAHRGLLKGLRIPAISLLLYWWQPEVYIPFNAKTRRFLEDFKLASRGMSDSSPACYVTWLEYADGLCAKLHLPSTGYVDRVIYTYYEAVRAKKG